MNYAVQSLDYFIYNNVVYSKGTEIALTKYAYEQCGISSMQDKAVIFISYNPNDQKICCLISGLSCIAIPNNNMYLECIIKPIYHYNQSVLASTKSNFITKEKKPDVFNGWLWYIFIALFLLICKNGIFYIIIVTLFFATWLAGKYKD